MNSTRKNSALLPSGFEDLLPPEAVIEYKAITALMAAFAGFGYERVKPPLVEFEESLQAFGLGGALAEGAFRFIDPLSQRMMELRSDITAQIVRIARTRLAEGARPLRLTYANDVVRMNSSQAHSQRQFTQVGCELVGADSAAADIEAVMVALSGLSALDLSSVTIDFALPSAFADIVKAAEIDEKEMDAARARFAGAGGKVFDALDGLALSLDVQAQVQRLKEVVQGVQEALDALGLSGVSVTVDLLETQGFEYHSGVAFTVFAEDARGEIGRGGRYDLYDGENRVESAAGFTLYMDALRRLLPETEQAEVKVVPVDTGWDEIAALRAQGFIVKREV